ncbi:MAG: type 4a pilus biogenesis protein PilO [Candidatus Omnitrophota bacterium]
MKNFKQGLNDKQKIIALVIFAVCLLYADMQLFIGPTMRAMKTTGPKVKELKQKYVFAKNSAVNIPKYKQQIEQFNDKLSLHKMRFSTNQEISTLLKELSTTARNTGVKIVAVKPHTPVVNTKDAGSQEAYKRFPISIRAVCGYHQLGVFLNNLENAETFMRVTDIRILSDSKDIKAHQVYLLVNTYIISGEEVS